MELNKPNQFNFKPNKMNEKKQKFEQALKMWQWYKYGKIDDSKLVNSNALPRSIVMELYPMYEEQIKKLNVEKGFNY